MSNQRGFTLLEVLLAGFILFLVLTSLTEIYRGALLSSGKAEQALSMTGPVPSIRVMISDALVEDGRRSGEGSYGDLDYAWKATLAYEGRPSLAVLEETPKAKYFLWNIALTVTRGGLIRQYGFREVSW
jgi:hypothetical protein